MHLGHNTRKRRFWGRRVRRSPSHRLVRLQLSLDATSTMMTHAPLVVTPPPVLKADWETWVRYASMWSKPPDLDVCLTPSSLRRFCGATDKSKHAWSYGLNQENIDVILRTKLSNRSYRFWGQTERNHRHRFWGQTGEIRRHQFWGQTGENRSSGFEAKPLTNRRPWFWGSTKKPALLISTCTVQTTHSTTRPPSTWPVWPSSVLCTRSPTPATILIAARHAAPVTCTPRDKQRDSPHDIRI
jgi:hypothetical protein